jgi:DNA mismatch repair protein MutS
MTAVSILFVDEEHPGQAAPDGVLADLGLTDVLTRLAGGDPGLDSLFRQPLRTSAEVRYRQEVSRDLEDDDTRAVVEAVAAGLDGMRNAERRAASSPWPRPRSLWSLEAIAQYCRAVEGLTAGLRRSAVRSPGLRGVADHLTGYSDSQAFRALADRARALQDALAGIRYLLDVRGHRVAVSRFDGEPDYSAEVTAAFARFPERRARDYLPQRMSWTGMNHVTAAILDRVSALHPDVFTAVDRFVAAAGVFADPVVLGFDRDVRFYLAYLRLLEPLRSRGLRFCYPLVDEAPAEVRAAGLFDLGLALRTTGPLVGNDVALTGAERILVVTGPNGAGKTTFARAWGQLHHLAALGLPVPGTAAQLPLVDRVLSHFERPERADEPESRFADELRRFRSAMGRATSRSLLVLNEPFGSTAALDAAVIGREVLGRLERLGCWCVCVTFLEELAGLGPETVSLTCPDCAAGPEAPTYRLVRRPPDLRSSARRLADAFGLGYDAVRRRIQP